MSELLFQSAAVLAGMIRRREISPLELLEAHLTRIEERNPALNAIVTPTFESARREACAAEQAIMRGEATPPLHGVPVTVKDSIETAGVRTVAGTRLREHFVPQADAPVVARLKQAGAIILGKTNVPECALDYRCDNPVFGRTCNPWAADRVPGGSSGGEAAAIASGCSAAGVGSDLGGSIRVPAHFCGIAGLKPTPGRIPGAGHFPPGLGPFALGASLGPLARRVEDLALLLGVLAGFEPSDPASVPLPARDWRAIETRGLGVMWHTDNGIAPVEGAIRETVERAALALAERGFKVVKHRPAGFEQAFDLWYTFLGEAGVPGVVAMYDGREELMGPLMRALKSLIRPVTFERFLMAWFQRDMLRASVVEEMMERPILLSPVASIPAFALDHSGDFQVDGQPVEYLKAFSYSQAFNLLALPAAVVPCGRSPEGLPIGVQVVGKPFEEETVLAVAAVVEEALGGYTPPPG